MFPIATMRFVRFAQCSLYLLTISRAFVGAHVLEVLGERSPTRRRLIIPPFLSLKCHRVSVPVIRSRSQGLPCAGAETVVTTLRLSALPAR